MVYGLESQIPANGLGNILNILLVFLGQEDVLDPPPMGSKDLFLEAADRQNVAPQGHLAGHGEIRANRDPRQCGNKRGRQRNSRRRAIFRRGTFGDVNVDIYLLVEFATEPQIMGAGAHIGHGCLRRFLHDLTQAPRDGQLALARDHRNFGFEQFSAHIGPGQTRGHAQFGLGSGASVAEFLRAKILREILGVDLHRILRLRPDHLDNHLATEAGKLALETPDTSFLGIMANQAQDGIIRAAKAFFRQTVGIAHLRHQVLLGNIELFEFRVARDADDLHPILQGPRDPFKVVGRGHEHHLGKIIVYVEVMIVEGGILFGVEDFEQSG